MLLTHVDAIVLGAVQAGALSQSSRAEVPEHHADEHESDHNGYNGGCNLARGEVRCRAFGGPAVKEVSREEVRALESERTGYVRNRSTHYADCPALDTELVTPERAP